MKLTPKKPAGKLQSTDEMIQEITVVNNKVTDLPLYDGTYTIIVLSNKERTRREWQQYYYSIIEEFCKETGNSRNQIHAMFKQEHGIESTKTIEDGQWPIVINNLKKWCIINQQ